MASSESRRIFCLLVLLSTLPCLLIAQVTGTITGTVRDTTGAVVPEARVTATNTETGQLRTVVTDGAGQYVLPQLAVGHYEVRVGKEGFSAFLQTGVLLQVNTQVSVDVVMQVKS